MNFFAVLISDFKAFGIIKKVLFVRAELGLKNTFFTIHFAVQSLKTLLNGYFLCKMSREGGGRGL